MRAFGFHFSSISFHFFTDTEPLLRSPVSPVGKALTLAWQETMSADDLALLAVNAHSLVLGASLTNRVTLFAGWRSSDRNSKGSRENEIDNEVHGEVTFPVTNPALSAFPETLVAQVSLFWLLVGPSLIADREACLSMSDRACVHWGIHISKSTSSEAVCVFWSISLCSLSVTLCFWLIFIFTVVLIFWYSNTLYWYWWFCIMIPAHHLIIWIFPYLNYWLFLITVDVYPVLYSLILFRVWIIQLLTKDNQIEDQSHRAGFQFAGKPQRWTLEKIDQYLKVAYLGWELVSSLMSWHLS